MKNPETRTNSVGTCKRCGYKGAGPAHKCLPVGAKVIWCQLLAEVIDTQPQWIKIRFKRAFRNEEMWVPKVQCNAAAGVR